MTYEELLRLVTTPADPRDFGYPIRDDGTIDPEFDPVAHKRGLEDRERLRADRIRAADAAIGVAEEAATRAIEDHASASAAAEAAALAAADAGATDDAEAVARAAWDAHDAKEAAALRMSAARDALDHARADRIAALARDGER